MATRKSRENFYNSNFFSVCDNCTQTLLDTVDEMIYKFEVNMEDTNLHNLHAPWIKLNGLSNETDYLSGVFDEYFEAVDEIDNFNDVATDEVSFIESLAKPIKTIKPF